jgi:hypothetical protein
MSLLNVSKPNQRPQTKQRLKTIAMRNAKISTPTPQLLAGPANTRSITRQSTFSASKPPDLVALQHAIDQIAEGTPVVPTTGQVVLVDEENVLLEARVEVRLETELADYGVMVAVNVGIDAVHALEDLTNKSREGLGERHSWRCGISLFPHARP